MAPDYLPPSKLIEVLVEAVELYRRLTSIKMNAQSVDVKENTAKRDFLIPVVIKCRFLSEDS